VLATVRSEREAVVAQRAGAHHVIQTGGASPTEVVARIGAIVPEGVDHVVEVAFHPNIAVDEQVLRQGGSIATYASGDPAPAIPFWPLVFKNISVWFLGSDDFSPDAKAAGARAVNELLMGDWPGFEVDARFPLDSIAEAHEVLEQRRVHGRVVLRIQDV
jgi:NADPH2:quinone reductase